MVNNLILQPFDWLKKTFFEKPKPEEWIRILMLFILISWFMRFADNKTLEGVWIHKTIFGRDYLNKM